MNKTAKGSTWPEKFPIARTVIAFLVIPLFSNLALLLINRVWSLTHSGPVGGAEAQNGLEWIFLAIIYSWVGYLTFLLLGLPTLYALYRLHWSGFLAFIVIGTFDTFLPWVVLGFGPHAHAHPGRMSLVYLWEEFKAVGTVGAINGVLTRLILLRW